MNVQLLIHFVKLIVKKKQVCLKRAFVKNKKKVMKIEKSVTFNLASTLKYLLLLLLLLPRVSDYRHG